MWGTDLRTVPTVHELVHGAACVYSALGGHADPWSWSGRQHFPRTPGLVGMRVAPAVLLAFTTDHMLISTDLPPIYGQS